MPLALRFIALAAAILVGALPAVGAGKGARTPEYQVKAEYLGALAEYVTWPPRPGGAPRPFVLGILGTSPFENRLAEIYGTRKVKGRPVNVLYLRGLERLEGCDAVFICESESERLSTVLQALRGRPVLTIGDTRLFSHRGVMINLYLDVDRVKFEVNLQAVKASGLEVGSHLLKLARIVDEGSPHGP